MTEKMVEKKEAENPLTLGNMISRLYIAKEDQLNVLLDDTCLTLSAMCNGPGIQKY